MLSFMNRLAKKNEVVEPRKQLHLYNTEKREKEAFRTHKPEVVLMYTCGPTVYNYAHIGNFRTYVFEDILRRTLKFFDYRVTQAMNITDIDDKTIRGAIDAKCSLSDYTLPYKTAFFADIAELGIERAEFYPQATDYIPQMIDFIEDLLFKEVAYHSKDKSVYFAIDRFPNYGRLSRLKFDDLKMGAGDVHALDDEYEKENASDFVLWKSYDEKRDGQVFWNSPFGKGRPGWHLECSAMAHELLGKQIDIHAGGVDLIFPHHENEIAQSECFTGHEFARFWLHSEHLLVDGRKMSKKLGNFYTLRDLLQKGYTGSEVRYMLMHTHYRTQLNFTFEGLDGARSSLQRINGFILRMQELSNGERTHSKNVDEIIKHSMNAFSAAMADDLNISVALAAVFDLIHHCNHLDSGGDLKSGDAHEVLIAMQEFNRILNVFNFDQVGEIPQELTDLLHQREEARKKKEWQRSDELRKEIDAKGYVIEDTPKGTRLKKK